MQRDDRRPGGEDEPSGSAARVHGWPAMGVVHDAAGEWHLVAGRADGTVPVPPAPGPSWRMAWSELSAEDPRLRELFGLPRGWVAVRSGRSGPWRRSPG